MRSSPLVLLLAVVFIHDYVEANSDLENYCLEMQLNYQELRVKCGYHKVTLLYLQLANTEVHHSKRADQEKEKLLLEKWIKIIKTERSQEVQIGLQCKQIADQNFNYDHQRCNQRVMEHLFEKRHRCENELKRDFAQRQQRDTIAYQTMLDKVGNIILDYTNDKIVFNLAQRQIAKEVDTHMIKEKKITRDYYNIVRNKCSIW